MQRTWLTGVSHRKTHPQVSSWTFENGSGNHPIPFAPIRAPSPEKKAANPAWHALAASIRQSMFQFQPDLLGFSDFLVRVEFPREPGVGGSFTRLELPASLLTQHSPVFASMVDGVWRESHERLVTVLAFTCGDFEAFLRCLALVLAASPQDSDDDEPEAEAWIGPALARRVLPIASYYQVEPLIAFIVASVARRLASGLPDRVDQATDLVLAIEESLPDIEHPHWDPEVLARLNARMIHLIEPSLRLHEHDTGETFFQTTIAYRPNDCLARLTPRTLRLCVLNLCMDLHQTLTVTNKGCSIASSTLRI